MLYSERRKYILEQLNTNGIINVSDTAKALDIHETTIRRDLEKLEEQGKLTRIHGGAKLAEFDDNVELTMSQKLILNLEDKKKVCERASKYVKDGDCIFIDGGTSTYNIINYLKNKKIKIVTNSSLVLSNVVNSKADIITLGGKYLPHYKMSVGTTTIEQISNYYFDYCFISCVGIDLKDNMVYTAEQETLDVKKSALKNSVNKILLIDSSKFNVKGFCKLSEVKDFDKIICNKFNFSCEDIENIEFV